MRDRDRIEQIKRELISLTNDFCMERIDEEYSDLCMRMIDKMARKKNVPFLSGKKDLWAASIIYSIGQINFLFDRSFEPFVEGADICRHFSVSRSSVTNKAKQIREMFKMSYFSDEFSTQRIRENNPFNQFVMLPSGIIVATDQIKELLIEHASIRTDGESDITQDSPEYTKTVRIEEHDPASEEETDDRANNDKKQRSLLEF
ncbi:MAG: DUF6398 domain-containing protein [Candidatus Thermoplasmatota archaeon]|nr:DUF6398 domain-containing protein [Candidatus Thermoplasmatota archaeon]